VFLFVLWYITFILLRIPSGLFCCVPWVGVYFMICGFGLFTFGVGCPCVLVVRCLGVAFPCTLGCDVG